MELEIVRTVFRNAVNDVSVYMDTKRDTGTYYTVVSILSREVSKELAQRMALTGLFEQNTDYIGSFTHRDALHLVFLYHPESRLSSKEALFTLSFVKRKEIALAFLAALAETELCGDLGMLLITDENINMDGDGRVYLNYFLNFEHFKTTTAQEPFYQETARFVFDLLTREYALKYDGQIDRYPDELRLMYKKAQNKLFKSHSQILTFVKALSDAPTEQRPGALRLWDAWLGIWKGIRSRPSSFILAVVVVITLGYLGYQVAARVIAGRQLRENTVYVGVDYIGEVFLGEEDV